MPYFWEDDVAAAYDEHLGEIEGLTQRKGLKVFDSHQIHVFLNSTVVILRLIDASINPFAGAYICHKGEKYGSVEVGTGGSGLLPLDVVQKEACGQAKLRRW